MNYVNSDIESLNLSDLGKLKYKAIQRYMNLIHYLERGIKLDYQDILEIMSLIDIYSELDKKGIFYKEFYLNGYSN